MKNDVAITIKNMSKDFIIYADKANTLKERIVRFSNNKKEVRHILKNINLEIKKGETVALIGVNGSGKSTLLKLITKIIYPTSGSIKVKGKLASLLELGAGFHPDFSGRENIYFNASIFGLSKKEIDKKKLFNTLLITCVSLLSILLLILILFVSGVIGTGVKHVVVPDISNMSIVEADDILDKLGLSLDYSNIERVMTENTKEGLIISSVPAIGEEADRGSKVKVIVSDGIYQTMEDLSGKKINDVKEMLKSKNFVVHEQAVEEDGEPGTIVRQEGVLANEKYNPNIQKQITLYYIQYPSILIDFGLLGQDVNNVAAYFKEKGIATEIVELKAEDLTEQEAAYGVNNLVRISPNEGMSYRQVDGQKITLFTYR